MVRVVLPQPLGSLSSPRSPAVASSHAALSCIWIADRIVAAWRAPPRIWPQIPPCLTLCCLIQDDEAGAESDAEANAAADEQEMHEEDDDGFVKVIAAFALACLASLVCPSMLCFHRVLVFSILCRRPCCAFCANCMGVFGVVPFAGVLTCSVLGSVASGPERGSAGGRDEGVRPAHRGPHRRRRQGQSQGMSTTQQPLPNRALNSPLVPVLLSFSTSLSSN